VVHVPASKHSPVAVDRVLDVPPKPVWTCVEGKISRPVPEL
jgi:hypothetical protein